MLASSSSKACTRGARGAARAPVRPIAAGRRARLAVRADAAVATTSDEPKTSVVEKTGIASLKPVLDIEAIKAILPHRYPFLLVDRVVELVPEKYAVGYKNITVNDQFFNGHFPERAIMPGVLQIEAMAQLGGIAMLDPSQPAAARNQFFFGGIEACRFRRPVVPGDTLMMRVTVTKFNKRFGIVKMDAKGYVGEQLAVEAELTLAMGKPEK